MNERLKRWFYVLFVVMGIFFGFSLQIQADSAVVNDVRSNATIKFVEKSKPSSSDSNSSDTSFSQGGSSNSSFSGPQSGAAGGGGGQSSSSNSNQVMNVIKTAFPATGERNNQMWVFIGLFLLMMLVIFIKSSQIFNKKGEK